MFCVFHPTNAASVQCAGCNRPLCAACDHRIKAQPFCEDCIVRGVDVLRRPSGPVAMPAYPVYQPMAVAKAPSPAKATLLSLIPGLGAVYNRQNLKAFVHFLGTVGLFELSDVTNIAFFGIGGGVFFLYSIIDANRSAKAIAAGADPAEDERRLGWLFARYKPVWGAVLIGVAILALLSSLPALPFGFTPARLWSVVLFMVGLYMIVSFFKSLRSDEPRSFPAPPGSVVSAPLGGEIPGYGRSFQDGRTTSNLVDR